jgi:hypothetical protein
MNLRKYRAHEQDGARFGVTTCGRRELAKPAGDDVRAMPAALDFPKKHGDSFPELCTSQTRNKL